MTSKEALRTILINCKDLLVDENYNVVKLQDLIKIIKQDLERLEALKQSNNILEKLSGNQHETIKNLTEENEKLKKAIKVFKNYLPYCNEVDLDTYITSQLTQQENELLKEVLGE